MKRPFSKLSRKRRSHNKWLVVIAAYKLIQATLILLIGVGARHLLHKDVGDTLEGLVDHLRFNPESRLIVFLLDKASLLNDPMLRRIGLVAFCYAALSAAEGIGLYLEKAWGEFLTLAITASFLPWEIYEIYRHHTAIRFCLLTANVLVFLYLLQLVTRRGKGREV
jgi:uncharacterized membrane protein (DUF2068 family)